MTLVSTPKYSFDDLKKLAELALSIPAVVEIVKNTPLNQSGKVNLTRAEKDSFEYSIKETGNLQRSEDVARSARSLAIIRRDYENEFAKLISNAKPAAAETKQAELASLREMEFKLPNLAEVVIRLSEGYYSKGPEFHLRFGNGQKVRGGYYVLNFATPFLLDLLNGVTDSRDFYDAVHANNNYPAISTLKIELFKVLEEKFGMKVKTCANCKWFKPSVVESGHIRFSYVEGVDNSYGWCQKSKLTAIVTPSSTCMGNPIRVVGTIQVDGVPRTGTIETIENAWEPKSAESKKE